ncbi:MAG: 4-hydroxy-tetrahydrodipicolinate reductase [Alphaproteobacteria bacterium]|nr:4-hydroxy-tetrahydrodipicolinate reductase [Alphaproteobacteria bacterium]
MLTLAISGAAGRMGQTLIAAALADARFKLVAVSERPEAASSLKIDASVAVVITPQALLEKADAVIDFTAPASSLALAEAAAAKGAVHIIGTTGFSDSEQKKIAELSARARIVQSGNFSLGVNLLAALVEQAAKALDDRYDIELFEMHHKHKKDAPSGTALMLGRAAATGRGVDFESKKKLDRDGERRRGDIGFSVARGGDVVGIHDVMLAGPGETITLSHQGFDRTIYASGALAAGLWAKDQKPGLYSMRDVLGF